jgi:hypothetical protein
VIITCHRNIFLIHTSWGKRLTQQALKFSAFNTSQFAIPGQTSHNAVLNKQLFLDLSCQTLSPGILIDYDATAAFNRVLVGLSIITCERLGLPRIVGTFMFSLLRNMSFHLMTGSGHSIKQCCNNDDPNNIGQGVSQGSSSAAPIFIFNSDASLQTYCDHASGASFKHPVSRKLITDKAINYVDDKTQLLNPAGARIPTTIPNSVSETEELVTHAISNTTLWNDIMWMSGGNLNPSKCFYYSFCPAYNFKKRLVTYTSMPLPRPITFTNHATKQQHTIELIPPSTAKGTLGVILAPNGSAKTQMTHLTSRTREFSGKLLNSSLSMKNKGLTVQSIIEPSLTYPLVNTYFSDPDIRPLDSIISKMKCSALGLNGHFPWALLHGSTLLGSWGIPTAKQKAACDGLNYFFIQCSSVFQL